MSAVTRRTAVLIVSIVLLLPSLVIADSGASGPEVSRELLPRGESMVRTLWGDLHIEELMTRIPSFGSDPASNYFIIQYEGPIMNGWRLDLERRGVKIIGYLPENCYIVDANKNRMEDLARVPHINGVSGYPSGLKAAPQFYHYMMEGEKEQPLYQDERLLVELFRPDLFTEEILGHLSPRIEKGSETRYVLDMPISSFKELIGLPEVRWVEPYYEYELHNNVSKYLTGTQLAWDRLGLTGKGQIVAIADTGIDTGIDNHSVDGDIIADLDNRVTISTWAGPSSSDTHSHGTHVAGSVAGNGSNSGGSIQGMAPEAEIFFQAIANQNAGNRLELPSNLSLLFQEAYDNGARIHTNSWGSSVYGQYTSSSRDVDWFLHEHPDMIILFSAGNSGMDYYKPWGTYNPDGKIDEDSIDSPATAKNTITVGASENLRLDGGYQFQWGTGSWLWKYSTDPVMSDIPSDDPLGLAAFSSRGPTDDGRLKPDVVAPGTNILSLRSTQTTSTGWGLFTHDPEYIFMGGTSMSTPITAGTVALIRDYFNGTLGLDEPSGALMKATLINGATDLTPGQFGTANKTIQEINRRPDNDQGWGRVNITESVSPEEGNLAFQDVKGGLDTGDTFETYLRVMSGAKDLRMTLAWSDSPGDLAASIKLVNDLDLTVEAPNGTVYRGNDLIHPFDDTTDRINPVEGISVTNPFVGLWKVTVNGTSIPLGPQHFAIVASGDISNFSGAVKMESEYYSTDGDLVRVSLYDQDLIGAGTAVVNMTSDTYPTGRLLTLLEDGVSGVFSGSIRTSNSSTSNTSMIHVSDDDMIRVDYTDTDPSGTFNSTAVAKRPVRLNIRYRPEYDLVYSEHERLYLNGIMDKGIEAWWTLTSLPMDWRPIHDDGNLTFGDLTSDDGNYSDIWYIPAGSSAEALLLVRINDPFLGPRIYEHFPISINSSLPRFPGNVSVTPLSSGNSVRIQWDQTNETDISHHSVWVNSSSILGHMDIPGWYRLLNTSSAGTNTTVAGLVDGVRYGFRVSAVDRNGNGSSPSVAVWATPEDNDPPTVSMLTTPRTLVGRQVFRFVGSPDLMQVEMEYYNDSNGNGILDDGNWTFIQTGYPDNYAWDTDNASGGPGDIDSMFLRYRGLDEVPNKSEWVMIAGFRIDNTGPASVEILNPPLRVTMTGTHSLNGRSEALGWVEVRVNGALQSNVTVDAFGGFSFLLEISEGANTVNLSAYDRYGAGPTNRSYQFTLDTMLPVALMDVEDQEHVLREIRPEAYLFNSSAFDTGEDPLFSYIENITWTYRGPDGVGWPYYSTESFPIFFDELGDHELILTVRDPAGNTNETTLLITVFDGTPPGVKIDGNTMVNEDTTVRFTANFTDNDPRIRLRDGYGLYWELRGPYGFESNHSSDVVNIVFPEPGLYNATLRVTDGGGNTASSSIEIIVKDITAPFGNIIGPGDVILGVPVSYSANVTDNGREIQEGALFNWSLKYWEGAPEGLLLGNASGTVFNHNFTEAGQYTLTLIVTDLSGNSRDLQVNIIAEGDLTNPTILSILPQPEEGYQFRESTDFIITFSERMDRSTINPDSIYILDGNGERVNCTLVTENRDDRTQVTLGPEELEYSMTYTVIIEPVVRDLWNNRMAGGFSANYTVRTLFRLVYPWGETHGPFFENFTNTTAIVLRFSNPVSASTLQNYISIRALVEETNPFTGQVMVSRIPVPFTIVQGYDDHSVLIDAIMDEGVTYNFTLSAEALDIYNYELDHTYTWEFTTYLPPVHLPISDDDEENGPLPEWMDDPIWWIIAAVLIIFIGILMIVAAAIRRRKNLDRIWKAEQGQPPRRRGYGETVTETVPLHEETQTEEAGFEQQPMPVSYENLYGSSQVPEYESGKISTAEDSSTPLFTEEMFQGPGGVEVDLPAEETGAEPEWDEDEEELDWGEEEWDEEEEEDWDDDEEEW